jgi:hypothetical protein
VSARLVAAGVLGMLFVVSGQSVADEPSGDPVVVVLTDGSRLVGTIVREVTRR